MLWRYSILDNQHIPVLRIGDFAAGLFLPGSTGRVLATTSKVTYLKHSTDELVWIVAKDAPMHRRAIQLAGQLPPVVVDSTYRAKDSSLRFDSDIFLDLDVAQLWKIRSLLSESKLAANDLQQTISLLSSIYNDLPSPTGFGIFIPHIIKLSRDLTTFNIPQRSYWTESQKVAFPIILQIAEACLAHEIDTIFKHTDPLIGLGEGLTPSGDDFVGGLFFCIRTLEGLFNCFDRSLFIGMENFLEQSKPRTNMISSTILKDHTFGHSFDLLHEFIPSLLSGENLDNLRRIASKLIGLGHSTGWDTLTGILTGTLLMNGSIQRNAIRF
jgi:hypothetical protein